MYRLIDTAKMNNIDPQALADQKRLNSCRHIRNANFDKYAAFFRFPLNINPQSPDWLKAEGARE